MPFNVWKMLFETQAKTKNKRGIKMKKNEITYLNKCMQTGANIYATTYIPSSIRDLIMEKGILAGPPLLIWFTPPDVGEE